MSDIQVDGVWFERNETWRGRGGTMASRPCPPRPLDVCDDDGKVWRLVGDPDTDRSWVELGVTRRPTTRWGWVRYHLLHGLLMRYPLRDVVAFTWSCWREGQGR